MLHHSDQEIAEKACNGDAQAFRQLVERHQAFVYRVAYRFVGDVGEAEDVTQESFIRLWKNLRRYNPERKLTTWLYKIVANLCLDFLKSNRGRHARRLVELDEYEGQSHEPPSDQGLIDEELRIAVDQLTAGLSPKQKAVFVLRDIEQLEMSEVSEILTMDAGQVKSNLYYARKNVSEMITAYYQIRKETKP